MTKADNKALPRIVTAFLAATPLFATQNLAAGQTPPPDLARSTPGIESAPPDFGPYTQVVYSVQPETGIDQSLFPIMARELQPCAYSQCPGMALYMEPSKKYGVARKNDGFAATVTAAGVFATVDPGIYNNLPTSQQLQLKETAQQLVDRVVAITKILHAPARPDTTPQPIVYQKLENEDYSP